MKKEENVIENEVWIDNPILKKGGVIGMRIVRCVVHSIEFRLPTTEEEFLSGKLHDEVIRIESHNEEYPQCKMVVKK